MTSSLIISRSNVFAVSRNWIYNPVIPVLLVCTWNILKVPEGVLTKSLKEYPQYATQTSITKAASGSYPSPFHDILTLFPHIHLLVYAFIWYTSTHALILPSCRSLKHPFIPQPLTYPFIHWPLNILQFFSLLHAYIHSFITPYTSIY
jgi:hypothetical protein